MNFVLFWSHFYNQVVEKVVEKYSLQPEKFVLQRDVFTNNRDSLFFNLVVNNISCQISKADVKQYCDIYFNIIRNSVPGRMSQTMFITWSGLPLASGGVSTQLNSFFLKCLPDGETDRSKNVSATLIRKSLLTFFYDEKPEMSKELGQLMKHDPKTGSKFYHLTRLRKECSATSQKVNETLFQQSSESKLKRRFDQTEDFEEERSGSDYSPDSSSEYEGIKRKRFNWTYEQEELLIELFGDAHYDKWHVTLIRQVASGNPKL